MIFYIEQRGLETLECYLKIGSMSGLESNRKMGSLTTVVGVQAVYKVIEEDVINQKT